jgi:hypothetical protein
MRGESKRQSWYFLATNQLCLHAAHIFHRQVAFENGPLHLKAIEHQTFTENGVKVVLLVGLHSSSAWGGWPLLAAQRGAFAICVLRASPPKAQPPFVALDNDGMPF